MLIRLLLLLALVMGIRFLLLPDEVRTRQNVQPERIPLQGMGC